MRRFNDLQRFFLMEGFAIKITEIKIGELDEFLENEEPFSDFFVLVQDDEHRELLEENYIFVPELGIDIHIGIWENWNEEVQELEADFVFYCFRDFVTKETIYTEQGSSLITCIHNFTGVIWEKIADMVCVYNNNED